MHEPLSPRLLYPALPGALLVAILAITGTAMSRAQAPDNAQTAAATDPPGADGNRGEESAAAVVEGPAEEQRDRPLEDYEASEQISEDLSVSFPVDI